jgi:beta-lactamase superfamily II metal-dependent hydrolase
MEAQRMAYEVDFLPVGDSNGDAICIRYGTPETGYTIHVVDGGYTDTGQDIVNHIKKYYDNPTFIDHVVCTHADQDHASGLKTVLENFQVGALWVNRPWLYAGEIIDSFHGNWTVDGLQKHIRSEYSTIADLEDIATRRGIPIREVFAGYNIGAFKVLSPFKAEYLKLIPDLDRTPQSYAEQASQRDFGTRALAYLKEALQNFVETWSTERLGGYEFDVGASNESSVVQMGIIDGRRIVLTADAGPKALSDAFDAANQMQIMGTPDVFQVPHHGSRRNVTPAILDKWLGTPVTEGTTRGTALCSVGKNKPEYPRRRVANAFLRRGYPVISTRENPKSNYYGMPNKPGWVAAKPEPFFHQYEE